jgi:hypothetical protein
LRRKYTARLKMRSPEDSLPHQDPPHEAQAPAAIERPATPHGPSCARIKRHKRLKARTACNRSSLLLLEVLGDAPDRFFAPPLSEGLRRTRAPHSRTHRRAPHFAAFFCIGK